MKLTALYYLFPLSATVSAVSFTYQGIYNAMKVITNDRNGNQRQLQNDAKSFISRNPEVYNSVNSELSRPVNVRGRNKLTPIFTSAAVGSVIHLGRTDVRGTAKRVINYAYEDNDVRTTIKNVMLRVVNDHPSIVDDFFNQAERVVRDHPELATNSKRNLIDYSRRDPQTYFKAADLLIRFATLMPDYVGHIGVRSLQMDLAACSRNCQCPRPRTLASDN